MKPLSADEFRKSQGLPPAGKRQHFEKFEVFKGFKAQVTMPPSVNHAYFTGSHGRRVLSTEGKKYKAQVREMFCHLTPGSTIWFTLRITLGMALYFKNGKVRTFDASNRIKLLEDAVFDAIGIDDSRVRRLEVEKTESDYEFAEVEIVAYVPQITLTIAASDITR
jgi:Holliday junction resolvase RusA-like endonuclease